MLMYTSCASLQLDTKVTANERKSKDSDLHNGPEARYAAHNCRAFHCNLLAVGKVSLALAIGNLGIKRLLVGDPQGTVAVGFSESCRLALLVCLHRPARLEARPHLEGSVRGQKHSLQFVCKMEADNQGMAFIAASNDLLA